MQCPNCRTENNDDALFCEQCGKKLELSCPACGAPGNRGARFCKQCGSQIGERSTSTAPLLAEAELRQAPTGERRHLTVLFCDLVGSTAIAAQLDPEEWREMVAGYHRAATDAITRFDGHVAKYLGDGVMAFFGYPQAHDNDGERAARAGLAIVEAIAKLNQQPAQPSLAARVGIDSGAVVVGAGAGTDADVFGDTPNIAARVQEAAAPGTVVVTEDTHRLITGLFVVEERGAPALKGVARSIELFRVVRPSGARGRLEAATAMRGLTPFVGREDELRSLMGRWEQVLAGEGQVALIIGEAGIGKSRLVQRLQEQIAGMPHTWIDAAAGPFFQNTPFYPVAEMIKQALGWRGDDPVEQRLTQLESALEKAELKPAEAIPLLAPLLNLTPSQKYPASLLPPEQQRRRLLATLVELALGFARLQPTVIATEDLHWADPSTLELIQLLVEQGAKARLLLVYTARPEFRAPWPMRAHHMQITLNRLNARDVRSMVGQVAARHALSPENIATVVERTGGVPLFVEELTRALLESGNGKLTGHEIPATLHDSLMARLDRLGPAKDVIQVGAVLGSEFSYDMLHAVYPIAEADLQHALRALADAELLYVRGLAPEAAYQFKHALIRDAAYEALLKTRRKELHRQVARTIDEQFTALGESHPEVLARHWTEAGETEPAIAQWSKAAEAARARNAFPEAMESCRQALALLNTLSESSERDLRELELRQLVAWMLTVTKGHAAPEVVETTARLAALAEKSGSLKQLVNLMVSRAHVAYMSGDFRTANILAEQTLELALREGSPTSLGLAHDQLIFSRHALGDLAGVEKHFTAWLAFSDDPGLKQRTIPGATVVPFGFASLNALALGRADLARRREAQMLAAAEASGNNPGDVAWSGFFASAMRLSLKETEQSERLAVRALEVSEQHQFPQIAAFCQCSVGLARALMGRASEGIELIREGIAGLRALGTTAGGNVTMLGWAQLIAGDINGALATAEEALQEASDYATSRRDVLALRGELRFIQGQTELAESDFRERLAIARSMGAKGLELGATMSLARLLDQTGRRDEARSMLAEIYGAFSEGFDTADLKDAKALLVELGA